MKDSRVASEYPKKIWAHSAELGHGVWEDRKAEGVRGLIKKPRPYVSQEIADNLAKTLDRIDKYGYNNMSDLDMVREALEAYRKAKGE